MITSGGKLHFSDEGQKYRQELIKTSFQVKKINLFFWGKASPSPNPTTVEGVPHTQPLDPKHAF